jgi:hypothetical protein
MHKYRELLYENKINAELNGDKRLAKNIDKKIMGVDNAIPLLQKNAMNSKQTLRRILKRDVEKRYGVKFSEGVMQKVESEGLTTKNIAMMLKEAEHQMGKKRGISIEKEGASLFNDLTSYAEVKTMWDRDKGGRSVGSGKDFNNLSKFQKALERSDPEAMNILRESNNFYANKGSEPIGNNKEIIEAGVAENGFVLNEIARLERKAHKSEEEAEKLAKYMKYAEQKNISALTDGSKKKLSGANSIAEGNTINKRRENEFVRKTPANRKPPSSKQKI